MKTLLGLRLRRSLACAAFLLGPCLGLVLPASAQAGEIGDAVEKRVAKRTDEQLSRDPAFLKATEAQRKEIRMETAAKIRVLEMQAAFGPIQREVDRKVDESLEKVLPRVLDRNDPRIPQIRAMFKEVLYGHMNFLQDGSSFYSMYEAANDG